MGNRFRPREKEEKELDAMRADLANGIYLALIDPQEAARRAGRICRHCGEPLMPYVVDCPLPWDADHQRVAWPDYCGCIGEADALEAEMQQRIDDMPEPPRSWENGAYGR